MTENREEIILIIDFGSQYKELIARRVREAGVFFLFRSYTITPEEILEINPIGIIFTGGPNSAYLENAPRVDIRVTELGIPILGICYGMQILCHMLKGEVIRCDKSEYGIIDCSLDTRYPLFKGLNPNGSVLMNHTDMVLRLPDNSVKIAETALCANSAFKMVDRDIYGVQFHPEVESSFEGGDMIKNFLFNVCNAHGGCHQDDLVYNLICDIRKEVGDKKVLLALSDGVNSAVCAGLLAKAIPGQVSCVYVDTGFAQNESSYLDLLTESLNLKLIRADARDVFIEKLSKVSDPERKRKEIGKLFVKTFLKVTRELGEKFDFLAQGTLYTDIVESGGNGSAVIKSHHNVGGLPEKLPFKLLEPLKKLFRGDVKKIGLYLGLSEKILNRQPFPGTGFAIRIVGRVTKEKLEILRKADAIVREEISVSNENPDQYFAILTNDRSVGVMGDGRTYDYAVVIRAVKTTDFMTCEIYPLPMDLLKKISTRITNEVKGVNRVVFDVTSKPPSTIEWE